MKRFQSNRTPRAAACTALAALLVLVSLTLTQCTTVGDNLTGVTLDRAVPTSCVRHCSDLYTSLFEAERKRSATELETCLAIDDELLRRDCLHAESARHSAALEQISAGKVDCLNSCIRPGTASEG